MQKPPKQEEFNIKKDGYYVDCTTGGGGHSYEIASRLSETGRLFCFDRDPEAIEAAKTQASAAKNAAARRKRKKR